MEPAGARLLTIEEHVAQGRGSSHGPSAGEPGLPVRLLLLAPPGAGKSTQGQLLARSYLVPHISTGDLIRDEIARSTPLGIQVAGFVRDGALVPDDVVFDAVRRRLTESGPVAEFVLDGFPRTHVQAELAYAWAAEHDLALTAVVHLDVPEAELARRAAARAATSGRIDDTAAVWAHRLEVYRAETRPLLDLYAERGLLVHVDAGGDVDTVHDGIVEALGHRGLQTRA